MNNPQKCLKYQRLLPRLLVMFYNVTVGLSAEANTHKSLNGLLLFTVIFVGVCTLFCLSVREREET